ncbi:MAG: NADH-quinone oxidoreductase subunit L [Candidatus Omnitrophica bacterium]|nr:NADH-quinone oxidoreductase subunit L [Candidatus Omnitrophota bacterium]
MTSYAYLIPVFPLLGFIINIFFGKFLKRGAAWVSILSSLASCALGLPAAYEVAKTGQIFSAHAEWLTLGRSTLSFGYLLDPLAATLLFVVTIIGTLIQIYSAGYMQDDPRFSRFFAYVSLFMSAMLTLVIADNYALFFMSWEVMGLCSYLLIGFWFEKNSAANAGLKAFLTTRVGDVGFFLGILTLFTATGNLNFTELESSVHAAGATPALALAALLIFCGTIGKSAQFPLHVWLPDAMEGPTPVSALIHAATMVAAGVYLVARSFALFSAFPSVMQVVVLIGTLTAFMAAFIALSATDIKKVLAYSTISQLGYMVTALGLGSLSAGTFHLMTHAYFKALLFLGAGSVIHGTHSQDIREMGGLLKKMPHTAWTFIIASLAIAGVPPLSGFWSKDEILLAAFDSGNKIVFFLLLVIAFMTAFYMFRLVFLTFFGTLRNHKIHPHESPATMTGPLWILALGAILVGLPGSPFFGHWFSNFIHGPVTQGTHEIHGSGAVHHALNWFVVGCSVAAGLGGILLAAVFYLGKLNPSVWVMRTFKPLYDLSIHKLWFDEIYSVLLVRPFLKLGQWLFIFDQKAVDGLVNAAGTGTVKSSNLQGWIDKHIVDGLVNLVGVVTQLTSATVRRVQTGLVQHYLLITFVSVILLMYFHVKP